METVPAASRRARKRLDAAYRQVWSGDEASGGSVVMMSFMARKSRARSGPPSARDIPRFILLREMKENQV